MDQFDYDTYDGEWVTCKVVYEKIFEDAILPRYATEGSAGADLHAYLRNREIRVFNSHNEELVSRVGEEGVLTLHPWERSLIPLGFKARLPKYYEGQIRPRSGLALKKGLTVINTPGTIDSDYPGEWGVILWNATNVPVSITHGERIAQLVLHGYWKCDNWVPGKVEVTTERTGGYGHTGT